MELVYHPRVPAEVTAILDYYERVAGPELAADFEAELDRALSLVRRRPGSFAARAGSLRRVNLRRFPYHLLFRTLDANTARILVVRHHRRHPAFGTGRR